MTEQTTAPAEDINDDETPSPLDGLEELRLLKERARTMGIPIGGNVGVETLRKKIEAKLAGSQEQESEQQRLRMNQERVRIFRFPDCLREDTEFHRRSSPGGGECGTSIQDCATLRTL